MNNMTTTHENVAVQGQAGTVELSNNDDSSPPPPLQLQQQESSRGARKSSYVPLRRMSGVEITEPLTQAQQEDEIVPVAAAAATPDIVKRQSSFQPQLLSLEPPQLQVTSSSFRPARRGTFQITGAKSLSVTQLEEPMEPVVTASSAHDLSDRGGGGTERSEDDSVLLLVSPTSVATRKISRALLRDVSTVKVQEPKNRFITTPITATAAAVINHNLNHHNNDNNNFNNNNDDNDYDNDGKFGTASTTTFGASNYNLSPKFEVKPMEPPITEIFSPIITKQRPSLLQRKASQGSQKKKSPSVERKVSAAKLPLGATAVASSNMGGGPDVGNDAKDDMATTKNIKESRRRRRRSPVKAKAQSPRQLDDNVPVLPELMLARKPSKRRTTTTKPTDDNNNNKEKATTVPGGAVSKSPSERKISKKDSKRCSDGDSGDGRLQDPIATDEHPPTTWSDSNPNSQKVTVPAGAVSVSPPISERKITQNDSKCQQQSSSGSDGRLQDAVATTDDHPPTTFLSDSNRDDSQTATVPGAVSVSPPSERKIARKDSKRQQHGGIAGSGSDGLLHDAVATADDHHPTASIF